MEVASLLPPEHNTDGAQMKADSLFPSKHDDDGGQKEAGSLLPSCHGNDSLLQCLLNFETAQVLQLIYSMEDLPEPLLAEIVKRITKTSDLNSLCLMSKQLCAVEAEHRYAIPIGC
ncbi:hypothetical protein D1007_00500 [Hordeum vulgare]|nr:hypothetical protein D1007_00500 [Hordeum vulgare]